MVIYPTFNNILSNMAGEGDFTNSAWFWIIIFIVVVIIVWLLLIYNTKKSKEEVVDLTKQIEEEDKKTVEPDDLEKIEGIGPKISALLQENGIITFNDLAITTVDKLNEILDEAKIHIAQPDTWPEQAELAANGKWNELEKLQDKLLGGRHAK